MSRYCGDKKSERILEAAEHWRERALVRDGSVFSDERLWCVEHLEALQKHFIDQPDLSGDTFFEKLERQLAPTEPHAKQLAAEMLRVRRYSQASCQSDRAIKTCPNTDEQESANVVE
jgi:hypothetical protein